LSFQLFPLIFEYHLDNYLPEEKVTLAQFTNKMKKNKEEPASQRNLNGTDIVYIYIFIFCQLWPKGKSFCGS